MLITAVENKSLCPRRRSHMGFDFILYLKKAEVIAGQ
jgi:hypothetical protein